MGRIIAGAVVGVVAWFVVALGIAFVLGKVAPDLDAALKAHATVTALAERLMISFAGSLIGGYLAVLIANSRAALIAGVLLLLFWGTYHVMVIWHQFPVWYHLTFFVSLPLLAMAGARLARR
ncbi:MAG: hypothetical protein ISS15_01705 [Alphaproteobacteria bacterium]|nr:hypothetical protein [Alphaproteobacteria bacterium]MBL6937091.1 hypothetical protein [Alphaproteobacteria bacterium]MBL7096347.1 hypothetical protein [Alphaproteobacteria bacterium]